MIHLTLFIKKLKWYNILIKNGFTDFEILLSNEQKIIINVLIKSSPIIKEPLQAIIYCKRV